MNTILITYSWYEWPCTKLWITPFLHAFRRIFPFFVEFVNSEKKVINCVRHSNINQLVIEKNRNRYVLYKTNYWVEWNVYLIYLMLLLNWLRSNNHNWTGNFKCTVRHKSICTSGTVKLKRWIFGCSASFEAFINRHVCWHYGPSKLIYIVLYCKIICQYNNNVILRKQEWNWSYKSDDV